MIRKALLRVKIWLKRATGIGYKRYPPLSEVLKDDDRRADELCWRARILWREVTLLERDLLHGQR